MRSSGPYPRATSAPRSTARTCSRSSLTTSRFAWCQARPQGSSASIAAGFGPTTRTTLGPGRARLMPGKPAASPSPSSLVPPATSTTDSPAHGPSSAAVLTSPPRSAGPEGRRATAGSPPSRYGPRQAQAGLYFLGGERHHLERVLRRGRRGDEVPDPGLCVLLQPGRHLLRCAGWGDAIEQARRLGPVRAAEDPGDAVAGPITVRSPRAVQVHHPLEGAEVATDRPRLVLNAPHRPGVGVR